MDLLKNLDNMMTAEQFLRNKFNINEDKPVSEYLTDVEFEETMIEFAKLHVIEALKQASEKASVEYTDLTSGEIFDYTDVITDDDVGADVNKDSILNAYPLENIK